MIHYEEYKPNRFLKKYIDRYWYVFSDKPAFKEKESLIPDGTIELTFNFGDSFSQISNNTKKDIKGSFIIGIRKRALFFSLAKKLHFFSIRFKAGGLYPFFKIPVYLFANNFHQHQDLFGNELFPLEEQLFETVDNRKRVAIVEKYLMRKLILKQDDNVFVEKCIDKFLSNSPPRISVNELTSHFNTNYKTIERKFNAVVGLTPTELFRIKRFNNAVLNMYSGRYNSLTEIAHTSGYYDQSHFIREFKLLTDYSPKQFLKTHFTIVQKIQPALTERLSKPYNF